MIVALLNGTLEFLQLQTFTHGKPIDWNFTCAYRRTHIRTGSAGSISDHKEFLQVMSIIFITFLKFVIVVIALG